MEHTEGRRPNPNDFSQRAYFARLCEELNREHGPQPYSRAIPESPDKTKPRH